MSDRYLMSSLPAEQRMEIIRAMCEQTDREQFGPAPEATQPAAMDCSGYIHAGSNPNAADLTFVLILSAVLLLALAVPVGGFVFLLGMLP